MVNVLGNRYIYYPNLIIPYYIHILKYNTVFSKYTQLKIKTRKKGWRYSSVAQCLPGECKGPEFSLQYLPKQKKKT